MARPKLGDGDTERLHVKISAEELNSIDDWRYENRIPSRSEAVRRLCQTAIAAEKLLEDLAQSASEISERSLSDLAPAAKHIRRIQELTDNWDDDSYDFFLNLVVGKIKDTEFIASNVRKVAFEIRMMSYEESKTEQDYSEKRAELLRELEELRRKHDEG